MTDEPSDASITPSATPSAERERQPRALYLLFLTEMWERFGFYGMQALLILYATKQLHFSDARAATLTGWYTGLVYLTPLLGGLVADRLTGYVPAILAGAALMSLGYFLLGTESLAIFYLGLGCTILGNGGFKANISTIVGKLYRPNDPRRDRGFTIFYMGINLGAVASPLVCGWVAENVGWHAGFATAGGGMAIGFLVFLVARRLLVGLDLSPPGRRRPAGSAIAPALGALTSAERARVAALLVVSIFVILFWAGFSQSWITLLLWADANTYRPLLPALLGGHRAPASWSQAIEPLFVIGLAPLVSLLWGRLARRGREPSTPTKMAFGLLLLAAAFGVMLLAARLTRGVDASGLWLAGCFFLMAIGELALSPVGLSLVTQLAPPRLGGLLMGFWFFTIAIGYKLGGVAGTAWDRIPHALFFGLFVMTSLLAAGLFITVRPKLDRLARGG